MTSFIYGPRSFSAYCITSPYEDAGICFEHLQNMIFNVCLLSQSMHVKFCIGPGVETSITGIHLCLYTGLGIGIWDEYWKCWETTRIYSTSLSLHVVSPCDWRYIYVYRVEIHDLKARIQHLFTIITGFLNATVTSPTRVLYGDICQVNVSGTLHVERGVDIRLSNILLYYNCTFGNFDRGDNIFGYVTYVSTPSWWPHNMLIAFLKCHYVWSRGHVYVLPISTG